MNDLINKGYVFLKSVISLEKIDQINNDINKFFINNNIQAHLNKREDSITEHFYVNNTFNQLNSFVKQQHYYLPVIDNRSSHDRIIDKGMIDIFNVHRLIPYINELIDVNILLDILNKLTQKEWKLQRINLHIYNNVNNTNNYHYDNFEETIKCTVYLHDIKELNEGPLSFIEGTHKNKHFSNKQIKHFYGNAGDIFLSYQQGFHRKLPQKNSINYILVFNFINKK
jgi:hypothetical protein